MAFGSECLSAADVFGWFDIEREPIAEHGMPLLILIGAHARLSNIDENGRFIKDEAFEYAGTPVFRKAGTSARGLLRSWVKLRNTNPKAREWLEYIDVMQQPSGFQDSIISTWRIEREASLSKYPQSLHSRDLNASYLSDSARQASFLSHEIGHFIGGKVTAVIQPTDTDVVFPLKAQATRTQDVIRRELREKAIEENTNCIFRCGPYECLRIAVEACKYVEKQNKETNNLLKCPRGCGWLARRPDFEAKKMVTVEHEPWAKEFPLGNHRMPAAWIEERLKFVDADGVPVEANWDGSGPGVKTVEDMEDVTQHGDLGCKVQLECLKEQHPDGIEEPSVVLECDADLSSEMPDDKSFLEQINAEVEQRRKRAVDEFLSTQVKAGDKKKKEKQQARAKIKDALRVLLPRWRKQMRVEGLKFSRKQLLEALVPRAGEKGKRKTMLIKAAEAV